MKRYGLWFIALAVALSGAAGCATSQEWQTWKDHPTHFASGDHLAFSMKNSESSPRVTRKDIVMARDEAWWGKPITVAQERILER